MMTIRHPFLSCALLLGLLPGAAHAEGPEEQSFMLLVASRRGGEGQRPLEFPLADAKKVEAVLRELGGVSPEGAELLLDPDPTALRAALSRLAAKLSAAETEGKRRLVYFYYSGHARARALSLGPEEFPLEELRGSLEALPATMRVVLLDACQSGTFTHAKGALPAEDFSFNSAHAISSQGLAVVASSAPSELSQESSALGASYFTHHLVSGLRGAADLDGDGRVSLDEAYRYTYRQTVASTMATRVGAQHPTMESDLVGRGEAILTELLGRGGTLSLPGPLSARVLVASPSTRSVWAEVEKSAGKPVDLALPPGAYEITLSSAGKAYRCLLELGPGAPARVDVADCSPARVEATLAKGSDEPLQVTPERLRTQLSAEIFLGAAFHPEDGYVTRLQAFDYHDANGIIDFSPRHFGASVGWRLSPHLELNLTAEALDIETYQKEVFTGLSDPKTELRNLSWWVLGASGGARAYLPVAEGIFQPYAHLALGAAIASSTLDGQTEVSASPYVKGGLGFAIMLTPNLGGTLELGAAWAEPLSNLAGEHRVSGGVYLQLGARLAFLGGEP
ncbi:MAG: caspase family protein [Myxococcota bacterium]